MAIKAVNQIDVIDLTDGYSVVLTSDSHTFLGTTAVATGATYTIGAGDITNKATFSAQLEG